MKRGDSGLSLIVGVNKPQGMSSHDVVNACRRIFGEKRVGHTGTLDPLASGVLPVCIGPAARLDAYMADHGKTYLAGIVLGSETSTDDALGEITAQAPLYAELHDEEFARAHIESLVGAFDQMPPAYSAIKVNGQKSYEAARKGAEIELSPRRVEVHEADLAGIFEQPDGSLEWLVLLTVSKGTYIRSIARDLGRTLGCYAHIGSLERRRAGRIALDECVSLETLETLKEDAALDPVHVLGVRYAFCDAISELVGNGVVLEASDLSLCEPCSVSARDNLCACSSNVAISERSPEPGELVCVVVGNRLKALYRFDAEHACWKPACVFSVGVYRG